MNRIKGQLDKKQCPQFGMFITQDDQCQFKYIERTVIMRFLLKKVYEATQSDDQSKMMAWSKYTKLDINEQFNEKNHIDQNNLCILLHMEALNAVIILKMVTDIVKSLIRLSQNPD